MIIFNLDISSVIFIAIIIILVVNCIIAGMMKTNTFLSKWIVRSSMKVSTTSSIGIINRPLKKITSLFPNNRTSLAEILRVINRDPYLRDCKEVNDDIDIFFKCLYDDREELLIDTMDKIMVIVCKNDIELLVFEFENQSTNNGRSIVLDIITYRSKIFQLHFFISCIIFGVMILL
jgi:hypothetical protein